LGLNIYPTSVIMLCVTGQLNINSTASVWK